MAEKQLRVIRSPLALPEVRMAYKSDPELASRFPDAKTMAGTNPRSAAWTAFRLGLSEHVHMSLVYDLVKVNNELRRGWPSGLAAVVGNVAVRNLHDDGGTMHGLGLIMRTEFHGAGNAARMRSGAAEEIVTAAIKEGQKYPFTFNEAVAPGDTSNSLSMYNELNLITIVADGDVDGSALANAADFRPVGMLGSDVALLGTGTHRLLAGLDETAVEVYTAQITQ